MNNVYKGEKENLINLADLLIIVSTTVVPRLVNVLANLACVIFPSPKNESFLT